MKKLFSAAAVMLLLIAPSLHADEVDYGYVITDNKPISISWGRTGGMRILISKFKDCEVRTYFGRRNRGRFILSRRNKPISQNFVHSSGIAVEQKGFKIEHYADGARTCCFQYNDVVYRCEKFALTVTIIDEPGKKKPDVRYTFYRLADQGF